MGPEGEDAQERVGVRVRDGWGVGVLTQVRPPQGKGRGGPQMVRAGGRRVSKDVRAAATGIPEPPDPVPEAPDQGARVCREILGDLTPERPVGLQETQRK